MAGRFEYTSTVFGVGLDGFSDSDHELLNDLSAEGWEPVNMTGVHNGFAAVVLFRREIGPAGRRSAPAAPAGQVARAAKASKAAKAVKAVKKTASRGAR